MILHMLFILSTGWTPLINNNSPYECSHKSLPDLNNVRVFGCLSYGFTLAYHRLKFDWIAINFIFIGYKPGTEGLLLYDINEKEFYVSRNIHFEELVFPYKPNPNAS